MPLVVLQYKKVSSKLPFVKGGGILTLSAGVHKLFPHEPQIPVFEYLPPNSTSPH